MHEIRIEALKKNYETYRDNIWKFATLSMAVLGWLLASVEARSYLHSSIITSFALSSTLILAIASHWIVNYDLFLKSKALVSELRNENEALHVAYETYALNQIRVIVNSVAITMIVTASLVLIWSK